MIDRNPSGAIDQRGDPLAFIVSEGRASALNVDAEVALSERVPREGQPAAVGVEHAVHAVEFVVRLGDGARPIGQRREVAHRVVGQRGPLRAVHARRFAVELVVAVGRAAGPRIGTAAYCDWRRRN